MPVLIFNTPKVPLLKSRKWAGDVTFSRSCTSYADFSAAYIDFRAATPATRKDASPAPAASSDG